MVILSGETVEEDCLMKELLFYFNLYVQDLQPGITKAKVKWKVCTVWFLIDHSININHIGMSQMYMNGVSVKVRIEMKPINVFCIR